MMKSRFNVMARKEFPTKIKAQAFKRCGGRCEGDCGGTKLQIGNIEYDHALPDGLGGEPTLANCKVLCRNCHGQKTHKSDRPRMQKADRIRKKAFGITRAKPRSEWKRKVNGETVRRDE